MKILKDIIEKNDSGPGKLFDLIIQSLIIYSLICFSIETIPALTLKVKQFLSVSETIVVIIFTVEYLLRLVVSERKIKFVFSFYGIIDLLAIAPFYLTTGIDLRAIRIFRLFRLIRAFKLIRYSKALKRFYFAIYSIRAEMLLFLITTVFLLFFSAVGIYYFENPAQPEHFSSIFDSLWWAVATLTTVGYGDIYPITIGGRIFTFFILMIGLGIIAVPTSLLSSALTNIREESSELKKNP
ncbi:MAG: ion transporter [Chlorobi bacterium]|nr:ion transporter [Chlorobiota bacterium]